MNFSAPFIPQFFTQQLQEILPYTDVIIGNESEAAAWASANCLPDAKDLPAIARSIALLPKSNPSRPRTVIFTQGAHETVAVTTDKPDSPKKFPVNLLADDQIVDTNGAGDAFAGGFLGALVAGKTLDDSVLAGHALARACVQQVVISLQQLIILITILMMILAGWTTIPMAKSQHPLNEKIIIHLYSFLLEHQKYIEQRTFLETTSVSKKQFEDALNNNKKLRLWWKKNEGHNR